MVDNPQKEKNLNGPRTSQGDPGSVSRPLHILSVLAKQICKLLMTSRDYVIPIYNSRAAKTNETTDRDAYDLLTNTTGHTLLRMPISPLTIEHKTSSLFSIVLLNLTSTSVQRFR